MKLEKELENKHMFCSSILRPEHCLKGINICCLLCDLKEECKIKNKDGTPPCPGNSFDLEKEGCQDLI